MKISGFILKYLKKIEYFTESSLLSGRTYFIFISCNQNVVINVLTGFCYGCEIHIACMYESHQHWNIYPISAAIRQLLVHYKILVTTNP